MSTQVFLRAANLAACDAWGSGTAPWNPNSAYGTLAGISINAIQALRLSRGGGVTSRASTTVTSGTSRYPFGGRSPDSAYLYWVSPPLDRDVTIASTVTFNLWGLEDNMSANIQMGCRVERILGNGTLSATAVVAGTTKGVELGTTAAVQNFTATPTSTAFSKGDRLLIVPYFTNIGTMATGFIATLNHDGTTAGANGDSYVTFTEDFGFMQYAPGEEYQSVEGTSTVANWGDVSGRTRYAFRVRVPVAQQLISFRLGLLKVGSPSDVITGALQADSGGVPSGVDLTSATLNGSSLLTTLTGPTFDCADFDLSPDTTYWMVVSRSGAVDAANYYQIQSAMNQWNGGVAKAYNGSIWSDQAQGGSIALTFSSLIPTTIYPTTTVSDIDPNGASYDAKEAWTAHGASSTLTATSTAAAPASPLQHTVSAGGNFIEWFTRPLQAFTLAGPVLVAMQQLESNIAANATAGVEIAVCNRDGTSPVVWGYTLHGLESTTLDTDHLVFVAGDDLAVASGQRIRIRFFSDDASAGAMVSGHTTSLRYNDTSGLASPLTFGQVLTEFTASLAVPDRQRRRRSIQRTRV